MSSGQHLDWLHPIASKRRMVSGSTTCLQRKRQDLRIKKEVPSLKLTYNGTIWKLNFLETILVYYVVDLKKVFSWFFMFTLPETNILATENQWLEDDMSFWGPAYFQVLLLLVSGSVPMTNSHGTIG